MTSTTPTKPTRKMNALEKNLLGVTVDKVPSLLPGLAAAALLAWLSIWLSKFIGVTLLGFDKTPVSAVMLGILLGLIIFSLAEGMYYLAKDDGDRDKTRVVRALTIRISLSLVLFVLLIASYFFGLIEPHGR